MARLEKRITYCGVRTTVVCDANCRKAWGINSRPRVELSTNPDDYAWLADDELGEAPVDPGTYEGDHAKPRVVLSADDMNKWCVRECERCQMAELQSPDVPPMPRDFSQRLYNIPRSS